MGPDRALRSSRHVNVFAIVAVAALLAHVPLVSCAKKSRVTSEGGVTLHLMPDRDVAEALLAHCEGAIALASAIESSAASPGLKSLAAAVRRGEQRDHEAITAWIKNQTGILSFGGEAHAREIRRAHEGVAEDFAAKTQPELDDFARRMMVGHYTEEVAEIRRTPARDKQLRQIADAMRRRMTDEIRKLSRPLGSYI